MYINSLSAENTAARLQRPNGEYAFNGVRSSAKAAHLLLSCLSVLPSAFIISARTGLIFVKFHMLDFHCK